MKILIDCSSLQVGGGIQVATSFINDLNTLNLSYEFLVVLSPQMSKVFENIRFNERFSFINMDKTLYSGIFKRSKFLKKVENKFCPNVIFTVFGPSYHKSKFPKVVGFAIPHLIYSKSPFFNKLSFIEKIKINLMMNLKRFFFVRNSDTLIFETDDSRDIFVKKYKFINPNYVVNNTLNQIFFDSTKWETLAFKFDVKVNYILCLTANYPHKNLQIIPSVIDAILEIDKTLEFKFVLSLSKEEVNFSDYYDKFICYIGRVELEKIPDLYTHVDVLFMPTLLEVFSTSYLEAMYMKKPIVASDMSFAKDICGDAAVYCSPMDGNAYAGAIVKIIIDTKFKNELVEKGSEIFKKFGTSMDRTNSYIDILKKESENHENTK